MNNRSTIENLVLEKDEPSTLLLNKYMQGCKKVSYDDILLACRKERFAKVLNNACLGKEWLIPVMLIPVMIFLLVWD